MAKATGCHEVGSGHRLGHRARWLGQLFCQ